MCLAQGPQRSDAGEARTRGPRSRVKHSTTEPLCSFTPEMYALVTPLVILLSRVKAGYSIDQANKIGI